MIAIIQARSNSKRFKEKILKSIYGLPMIIHVAMKVNKSNYVKKLIVATSKSKMDDNLIKVLKAFKIKYFRGELNNVASRFLKLAIKKKCKYFIRINGDSPLIDSKIIDKAIRLHKKNKKFDLISNVFPRTYPKGQSVEIIKVKTLKNNINKMSKSDLEHVTKYFYKNYKKFKIKNFKNRQKKRIMKLSIDTISDLKKITNKFKKKNFINFNLENAY
tara:strand:- start:285 stop:935 length:651 start_codon:yes stop_codon:yes gene_type:complete